MNLDPLFFSNLAQAIGLGFGVALILWLLRRYSFVRKVWISVLGMTLAVVLNIILQAVGITTEELSVKIVTGIAILLAANAILQVIDLILWSYLLGSLRHIIVPRLLVDLFNVIVLVGVALGILDRVFEVNLTAVLVTSTVVSAVIGLSLQDTLGNVMSGVAMQFDRPFDVGDWVQISGQDGEVIQMNWRTIMLRSIDNHWFVIPNSNVARHEIINYSQPTVLQRFHASIGLSYACPPGEVKRILKQAMLGADGVRSDPPPDVLLLEYGDSAIIYDVRYWVDDFARSSQTRDAILTRIWYVLQREGMSIPFPIRDVNVRQVPEDHDLRKREMLRREIFTQLRPLMVLEPLSDEQIEQLAQHAQEHRYTEGEVLVRQGDEGDSLFVIKSGRVQVDVRGRDGRTTTVANFGPGDFFGEMSLLTGERRSASVIAVTETEVVMVDKDAIAQVLATDMDALEGLSQVVAHRLQDAAEKVAAAAESRPGRSRTHESNLLVRIQGFLGLK